MSESSTLLLCSPTGGDSPESDAPARRETRAIRSAATDPRCLDAPCTGTITDSGPADSQPQVGPPGTVVALVASIIVALLATATAVARAQQVEDLLPAAAALAPGAPIPPDTPGAPARVLPRGKGMWMWQVGMTEGGRVDSIIARAKGVGLTHIYVRTGSSWDGFYGGEFLNQMLPAAHAAGIRVYGWDFPHLRSWETDVARIAATIGYHTPDGHSLDGFAVDIETRQEGTYINAEVALAFGQGLRAAVGPGYPLIAVVPRPSAARADFPYPETQAAFDAIAPMVYWLNREPGTDVAGALADLSVYGKPVIPIGQAYDGGPEGGRPGVPPREELLRFVEVAHQHGAAGVSFWSWQAADQEAWDAIKDAPYFTS